MLARLELLLVDLAPRVPLTQDFQRFVASVPTSLRREPPHTEDEPGFESATFDGMKALRLASLSRSLHQGVPPCPASGLAARNI